MSGRTKIQWTNETWNPIRGCSRVSPGCEHCYAESIAARFSGPGKPFHGFAQRRSNGQPAWTGRVELLIDNLTEPLHWRRPRRVFVNSMTDLFHERLPFEHIATVFAVMALAPQHTFQVLTKRPARMLAFFRWVEAEGARLKETPLCEPWDGVNVCHDHAARLLRDERTYARRLEAVGDDFPPPWPLPNVWLGVSCEDQQRADERIPLLLETPAAVRFVSAEPLLGPVNLRLHAVDPSLPRDQAQEFHGDRFGPGGLDWVIVGGESGRGARPCDVQWIHSIVVQCQAAGVPVFVKQIGANVEDSGARDTSWAGPDGRRRDHKGGDPAEWPQDLRVRQYPEPKAVA